MADLDFGATITGFRPGQKVFNRYTLVRLVGRGGMGMVWLARDDELEQDVALKFLPELVATDKAALDDLRRETRRSRELTHSNIVRIHDFERDERTAAISMEFVNGDTLANLRTERPGKVFEAVELHGWVRQLCEALDYAHTKAKVVHRDLKPANLMIDQHGDLKVTDFGISATVADSATRVSKVAGTSGTPVYMSPQQMLGQRPAVTDDIYSLGATLYELLTGKPPFYSGNVLLQVEKVVPPSITDRRDELEVRGAAIPPEWEETIAACLAKEPTARPQSAGEVAARLGVGPPLAGGPLAPHQARHGADVSKVESRGSISDVRGQKSGVESRRSKEPAVGPDLGSAPDRQSKTGNLKSKILAAAAAVAVLGGGAWYYFGSYLPAKQAAAARALHLANARGGLVIRTEPAGAEVRVGGLALEKSPLTLKEVKLGKYPVQIRLEGYDPVDRELAVAENQFTDPGVLALVRSTGRLALKTEPTGMAAAVRMTKAEGDHRLAPPQTAKAPATLTLPTGDYEVTFSREGWAPVTRTLSIARGQEKSAEAIFAQGEIEITSAPAGQTFKLMGGSPVRWDKSGTTPAKFIVPPGRYAVELSRAGWQPVSRSVDVAAGKATVAAAEFPGGGLEITSTPADAEVWAQGKRLGVTPLKFEDLAPGAFELEFRLKGYKTANARGQVAARTVARSSVVLEEIPRPKVSQKWAIPELNLEMLPIAPGTFTMGSPAAEWGRGEDEGPPTRVTITQAYWLGKTEVTQGQWSAVMGNNPSNFKGEGRPVENVSWTDAMDFCRKLTEREGGTGRLPEGYAYTLPTEAQWEFACRAGTTGAYAGNLDAMGWYDYNGGSQTHPAGQKQANAWGLYDMHGNVREWCLDWFGNYPNGAVTDPTGPASGSDRVRRGGSWLDPAHYCESARRSRLNPGGRDLSLGFRLALAPEVAK